MRTVSKLLRFCALGSAVALAGCASSWGGPGVQVGIGAGPSPSFNLGTSSCSLIGSQTPIGPTASTQLFAFAKQEIRAAQARSSLGAGTPQARMESWKRIAAGGC
jgi:hypothetical protein